MKPIKKFLFFFLLFVLTLALGKWGISRVRAVSCGDSCSDTPSCQAVADECTKQITLLQSQANTLSNQIAQFNAQIYLTTLKIQQTEDKITLLGGRINQLEISLNDLNKAFSSRAVETYKMYRIGDPFMILVSATDLSDAVSRFHYLQKIEEADRDLLNRLQTAQADYKSQKTTQEQLQAELKTEKTNLDNQKIAKNTLLAQTQNDEKTYENLRNKALEELAGFANFAGNAPLLDNQTYCDDWGCYYNQRDRQWGNILIDGSNDCNGACSIARVGCLITSVAMVASHLGHRDILPNDIALSSPENFAVGTALLKRGTIMVNGVNINWTASVTSSLSPDIVSNGPVIVGLYYGPYGMHFVVIKSYTNGNYIMNDPYTENGHDKNFTDYYSLSNVFEVDSISL